MVNEILLEHLFRVKIAFLKDIYEFGNATVEDIYFLIDTGVISINVFDEVEFISLNEKNGLIVSPRVAMYVSGLARVYFTLSPSEKKSYILKDFWKALYYKENGDEFCMTLIGSEKNAKLFLDNKGYSIVYKKTRTEERGKFLEEEFLEKLNFPNCLDFGRKYGKPLCFLDIETVGFPTASFIGIVEIGFLYIELNGIIKRESYLLYPGGRIPDYTSKVHGIKDVHVRGKPEYPFIHNKVVSVFENYLVSGFNIFNFDFIYLSKMAKKYNLFVPISIVSLDVRDVWLSGRSGQKGTLVDVAKKYGVMVEKAHRAGIDIELTANILEKMLVQNKVSVEKNISFHNHIPL